MFDTILARRRSSGAMAERCTIALVFSVMVEAATGLSVRLEKDTQTIYVSFDQDGTPVTLENPNNKALAAVIQGTMPILANETQCLNFLHIPKTGGTTIESRKATGLWDRPNWAKEDETLRCTGEQQCPEGPPWRGHNRCCTMEDGNVCSVWHVPPHMDSELQREYAKCETFCVVRDPASRFRSQHVWSLRHESNLSPPACSTESVSDAVYRKLEELGKHPYVDDCHFIPQVEYWRNGQNCQHVLKLESLEADFTKLVAKFGMKAKFQDVENPQSGLSCLAPFDQRSLQKLQEHYAADYEAFGYELS